MFIKINKIEVERFLKRILYDLSIIVISVSVVYIAAVAYAGSLTPPAGSPPGITMMSLNDIYNALAGNPDVSGVLPREDGSAMDILKCITNKMNNGVCN